MVRRCAKTRETLVLAVHEKTHDALKTKRRAFFDRFEVHELQPESAAPTSPKPKKTSKAGA